jgi:IS5 family transposase
VRQGTLIDATLVASQAADPGPRARDRQSRVEPEARWTRRGHKHGPLPPWAARRNRLIQPIRAAAEGIFGLMKRSYGYRKLRYIGLTANAVHLDLLCTAINLRRAEALLR